MAYGPQRALDQLRIGAGLPNAEFRPGQEEAIRKVVVGRRRLLVVQKTGWGKSLVYFIAVKLLREAGMGPALLISPLLALMRNQIAAAERMGVRAATIHSDNQDDCPEVEAQVLANAVDILLVTPLRGVSHPLALCAAGGEAGSPRRARPMRDTAERCRDQSGCSVSVGRGAWRAAAGPG